MPIMPPVAPIVSPNPSATPPVPPAVTPIVGQTTDPTYSGVAVDTQYTPRGSLLTYAEGANWTVNYYRQLVGQSSELSAQQVARPGAYQQYELIHNMLLKVTQPLATSQDQESKSMMLSGAALAMVGLIPNVGDMFVADAGDGRTAIFVVTASDKKSFLKDALYQIEYDLKDYATAVLLQDLNDKVVEEATYVAGNLLVGKNPVIATADLTIMQQLGTQMDLLISQYFKNFFSVEFQTLLVPDQVATTYDTFATHAVLNFVPTEANLRVKDVRLWNVNGDYALQDKTLWDALYAMRYDMLPLVHQQMGTTSIVGVMNRWPYFMSIYFSGISQLVYPMDQRTDVDAGYGISVKSPVVTAMDGEQPVNKDIGRLITKTDLSGLAYTSVNANGLPDILPVTTDNYYVFSQAFYTQGGQPGSCLEQLTLQALQGQQIDLQQLLRLATNAPSWGNLDRYYYVPVIIALIRANIGTV